MSRRERILDAAIVVIGDGGARALTHRSVDQRAVLASGSTSNLFRTRQDLLIGLVERFCEREREAWEEVIGAQLPLRGSDLGRALGDLAVRQVTSDRAVSITRYAILIEAATTRSVRDALLRHGSTVFRRTVEAVRTAGSSSPESDAVVIAQWIAGAVLHELAVPSGSFAPHAPLAHLIEQLFARRSCE